MKEMKKGFKGDVKVLNWMTRIMVVPLSEIIRVEVGFERR